MSECRSCASPVALLFFFNFTYSDDEREVEVRDFLFPGNVLVAWVEVMFSQQIANGEKSLCVALVDVWESVCGCAQKRTKVCGAVSQCVLIHSWCACVIGCKCQCVCGGLCMCSAHTSCLV